jgi:chorismate dehydratase
MRQRLRVGSVPYLVARPLNLGLEHEPRVELVRDVPARLVERLRAGALDVALLSSIELFREPGYAYLAGPAVAGNGYVASVQVFLRRPVGELRQVVLDPASRTAQVLARIVLGAREPGVGFEEVPLGSDPRSAAERSDAGGWLRIGDRALIEVLEGRSPHSFNPSRAWHEDTGLPFVFALWIVRPGLELLPEEVAVFAAARARGRAAAEELAREAAGTWGLPLEPCRRYLLEECLYEPGDALAPALLELRDRAAKLALCRGDLAPRAIPVGASPCRA